MFRMYASNSHSYTHLILALGIVREPTVWGFITSEYPGIHDIGLPSIRISATCRLTRFGNTAHPRRCLIACIVWYPQGITAYIFMACTVWGTLLMHILQ